MKNREKYRDEIMEAIKNKREGNDSMCCFIRDSDNCPFMEVKDDK